jgi:hypothetical protein
VCISNTEYDYKNKSFRIRTTRFKLHAI